LEMRVTMLAGQHDVVREKLYAKGGWGGVTVESRIGLNGGFGLTSGKLLTLK